MPVKVKVQFMMKVKVFVCMYDSVQGLMLCLTLFHYFEDKSEHNACTMKEHLRNEWIDEKRLNICIQ